MIAGATELFLPVTRGFVLRAGFLGALEAAALIGERALRFELVCLIFRGILVSYMFNKDVCNPIRC